MKKIFLVVLVLFFILGVLGIFALNHKKAGAVKIKFSSWGSESETAIIKTLIKEFETQNPGTKVEFVHVPQNYFQKLHLLFASNLAPDVVFLNNYYAPKYVKAGLLEDLTGDIEKEKFFDKAVASFTFDDKIYAVPRDVSELVVYYNKDLFRKNGIPFPKYDWTIEKYKKIAKKFSKDLNGDGVNDVWGTGFETDPLFWLPFLMSNGGAILSEDGQKLLINQQNSIAALDEYAQMAVGENIAPTKPQSAGLTMAQMFLQGKIAMHISGRWLVPKYREQAEFDWDIVEFPSGSSGSVMNIDASGYAVSKASRHKKQALEFVKFMTDKSSMDKLTESGLIVPALKASAYDEKFMAPDKKPKNAIVYLSTIENGRPTPVNAEYQRLLDELNRTLEPVFLGYKKAEEVLSPALQSVRFF